MEMAAQDAEQLRKPPISVHKVQKSHPKPCYRCGNSGHSSDKCYFRNSEYHGCGKLGHIRSVCRNAKNKPKQKERVGGSSRKGGQESVHAVESNSQSEDEEELSAIIAVESIRNKSSAMYVNPTIDGQPIQMELDTGAAVSVMPKSTFAQLKPQPKLKPTTVKLKTFSGELMKPIGVAEVNVVVDGQSEKLDSSLLDDTSSLTFEKVFLPGGEGYIWCDVTTSSPRPFVPKHHRKASSPHRS